MSARFLTAEWRYLLMLNYEIDPAVLVPLVPPGLQVDSWQGHTFASMVGFLFLKTRVLGIPIPFHRNFEEVNLRFYVRRETAREHRRGVVFVKEIVPRIAIAATARVVYGENYVALPTRHRVDEAGDGARGVEYAWRFRDTWHSLSAQVQGEPAYVAPGSEQEFVTEHYWGYAKRRGGGSTEYEVGHPRWRVWPAADARLDCDVGALYGPQFAAALSAAPTSAFVADGSPIAVYRGVRLT